jgi:protein-disulfide isomerase
VPTLHVPISATDHIQGKEDATIVLVEYGDYQCPHCGRAYPMVKRVQKHLGRKLAFVFRNFPLGEAHPEVEHAAETAEYAAAHGRFWEMHDAIFENQEALGLPLFLNLAEALGLPSDELENALASGKYADRVQADFVGGIRSGVNGTPSFFINGNRYDGPYEFEDLVAAIESELE